MEASRAPHLISASASVPAQPERVYAVIANYRTEHPHILPEQFSGLTVEKGGIGAGTIIRFDLRLMGRTQRYRAAITEPQPGHVLMETVLDGAALVTTFTVAPAANPGQARVTIATELPAKPGLSGWIERIVFRRLLRPLYERELALLARYVATPARSSGQVDAA